MRLGMKVWSGLVVGSLVVGLPGGVMGLDGVAVAQTVEDRQAEAGRLLDQGIQQGQTGQFRAALQSFEQALAFYRTIGDRWGEAGSLGNLGIVYRSLGQYEQAIVFQEQSLEIAREIGNRQGEAASLGALGNAYYSLGQYERAIVFHEQSLDLAQEIGDRQAEASILGNLGNAYDALGQYQRAISFHEQSLEITREIGDRQGEANSLGNLGNAYNSLGQYERAISFHEQSLEIKREIGDRQGEANSLGNLGLVYNALGQYQQALTIYEQSFEIAQEIGDKKAIAVSLNGLGNAYSWLGQYQFVLRFNEQALKIAQGIGDRRLEAHSLGNLGLAYDALGQYQRAIIFYERTLEIAREIGDRGSEARVLSNLGLVSISLGHYQHAITFFEQALEIAQEIGDRQAKASIVGNMGDAYSYLGQYRRSISFVEQHRDIAREIGDRRGEASALNSLGFAFFNLENYSEAEQQLLAAAEIYEAIRADLGDNDTNKISIFEEQSSAYRLLQRAQIAQDKTTAALEITERGRARAFVELLHRRLNPDDPNPQINPPNLAQIKQIAEQQNATLVQYSIIGDIFDLDDNPGKESSRESALYIWVITPSGQVTFRQVDLTPLWRDDDLSIDELVQFTRDSLGVRGLELRTLNRLVAVRPRSERRRQLSDDDYLLRKLHELLIAPIQDLLPTDPEDRVIFIPQSSLFLVPFPALKNANGDYLIQQHTILTASSIQTLELTRAQKNKPSGNGALIVGNPTMPSIAPDFGETPVPLSSLPGAEQEAEAIADLLNTDAMTGNAATKSRMVEQMQDAEIIHLATHGLLDDVRGIGSAIALAPDRAFQPQPGAVNGLLTAEEIFDMDLKAELVVLSACDTGRGRITGDGVVGLSRSFVSAGVPSVLVSLWAVPDAPTANLMTEFYQQREQLGDNAQALRQAMLTTMQTNPEPRNWAAFTLIGEAD